MPKLFFILETLKIVKNFHHFEFFFPILHVSAPVCKIWLCWLVFCMVTFGFKKSMNDFQSFRTCFSVKIKPNLEMMHKKQQSEVGTIHYMKISQKIKSFRDDINSFITFAIHDICLNYSVVSQQDLVCK